MADLYDLYVISDLDIGFYLEEAGKVQGFKFASNGVLRSSPKIHSEFIRNSSPAATVEGARRPLQGACKANPALQPPDSSCGPSSAVKRVASGRRKTEAAVEASLGSLDHKCT